MSKRYSELIQIPSFEERYEYLKIGGKVGERTFGADRYLNQLLYTSKFWMTEVRPKIIVRDNACDMAHPLYDLHGFIIIHHINPITKEDIINRSPLLFDPENLVVVSKATHLAIHYSDKNLLPRLDVERKPGDTKLW